MTRQEIALNTATKEFEKAEKSLARHTELLAKKQAKVEKLNCNWSLDEFNRRRDIIAERHPNQWIIPFGGGEDDDIMTKKQSEAWWSLRMEQHEIEEAQKKFDRATKNLAKATGEWEEVTELIEQDKEIQSKESSWWNFYKKSEEQRRAEYERWLKEFKADCLKDGVVIDKVDAWAITGTTKRGKHFCMRLNEGWTQRSNHCYSLYIDGETLFTSGNWGTGYRYIKH